MKRILLPALRSSLARHYWFLLTSLLVAIHFGGAMAFYFAVVALYLLTDGVQVHLERKHPEVTPIWKAFGR